MYLSQYKIPGISKSMKYSTDNGVPVCSFIHVRVRVRIRKNEKNLLLPVPVDLH